MSLFDFSNFSISFFLEIPKFVVLISLLEMWQLKCGCSMADETAGEVPVAFVVRVNGANITELEIKRYIAKQVIHYLFLFTEKIIR